ncbi:hypothetical protein JW905_16480 [bacterium]|nr:hypothetical protein [candidate division CSSED10-310 bacterium]
MIRPANEYRLLTITVVVAMVVAVLTTCAAIYGYMRLHGWYLAPRREAALAERLDDLRLEKGVVRVQGAVAKPGSYSLRRLAAMPSVTFRYKEYEAGEYVGTYVYSGVPLRLLVQAAEPLKPADDKFPRLLDMVIKVRDAGGRSVYVSYGELETAMVENRVIVALRAAYRIPTHHPSVAAGGCGGCHVEVMDEWHDCTMCHNGDYKPRLNGPETVRLIWRNDAGALRVLEEPAVIEVIAPREALSEGKGGGALMVTWQRRTMGFIDAEVMKRHREIVLDDAMIGMGVGFHTMTQVSGVSLIDVLVEDFGVDPARPEATMVYCLAADGYRAVFSWTELAHNLLGQPLLLCMKEAGDRDRGARDEAHAVADGPAVPEFSVYPAFDLFVDRGVKFLQEIRVVEMGESEPPADGARGT